MSTNPSDNRQNPKTSEGKEGNLGQKEAQKEKEQGSKLREMGERSGSANKDSR